MRRRQELVPDLSNEEWTAWAGDPGALLACPDGTCGVVSAAYWSGGETVRWSGCGHRAFLPEWPVPWPPPRSHCQVAGGEGEDATVL